MVTAVLQDDRKADDIVECDKGKKQKNIAFLGSDRTGRCFFCNKRIENAQIEGSTEAPADAGRERDIAVAERPAGVVPECETELSEDNAADRFQCGNAESG